MAEKMECECRQCLRDSDGGVIVAGVFVPAEMMQMIVCSKCGNKRCPHATDHRNDCTGSNAPGQAGSSYE